MPRSERLPGRAEVAVEQLVQNGCGRRRRSAPTPLGGSSETKRPVAKSPRRPATSPHLDPKLVSSRSPSAAHARDSAVELQALAAAVLDQRTVGEVVPAEWQTAAIIVRLRVRDDLPRHGARLRDPVQRDQDLRQRDHGAIDEHRSPCSRMEREALSNVHAQFYPRSEKLSPPDSFERDRDLREISISRNRRQRFFHPEPCGGRFSLQRQYVRRPGGLSTRGPRLAGLGSRERCREVLAALDQMRARPPETSERPASSR